MKITVTTFLKHKVYLFSFFVLITAGLFSSLPAYSQMDYNYGITKKGFRLGLGAGGTILETYWGSTPISPAGVLDLDYNTSPFFSIGLNVQYGLLVGVDDQKHYAYLKSTNTYTAASLNFKVALGQFSHFHSSNGFGDALKRLYLGTGVGAVYSKVILADRFDGLQVNTDTEVLLARISQYSNTRAGTFMLVPVNFGTNIDLLGVFGNDKLEINPNFQYNLVMSKVFDGMQPNDKSGNGGYGIFSISLKYKF